MEQRILLHLLPGTGDHEAQVQLCLLSLGRGQAMLSAIRRYHCRSGMTHSGHHYGDSETMVSTDLAGREFRRVDPCHLHYPHFSVLELLSRHRWAHTAFCLARVEQWLCSLCSIHWLLQKPLGS